MLQRFLLLWLVLSSGLALFWPRLGLGGWLSDPLAACKPSLNWFIAATMLAVGVMLPRDEVQQVFRRWPSVLAGTAIQYTAMPLLAYSAARLWGLEGGYLIGMVMVGCVPGAMASNVLTYNAHGNTSYSVSLTTSATLVSPIAVPAVLALLLATGLADFKYSVLLNASVMLVLTVVLPVTAGHLLMRLFPKVQSQARRWGSVVANLSILWIIAVIVALFRDKLAEFRFDLLWALLAVNICGYLVGYFGGFALRLPEPMRRALTLEVGMQNAGLGAVLASNLFGTAAGEIAVAPAMYMFGCMLTGTLLATAWSFVAVPAEK